MEDRIVSGWGSLVDSLVSISLKELLAVKLRLQAFQEHWRGLSVAIFCHSMAAVLHLRKSGCSRSALPNQKVRVILRWSEERRIPLLPQFIIGKQNLVADALGWGHQVLDSEWTLSPNVVLSLQHRGPVSVNLFATAMNFHPPNFFTLVSDLMSLSTDAVL